MVKILLIEDDEILRESVADFLKLNGYTVEVASDGKAGLSQIARFMPDLVLCDVKMPIKDGYSVLQTVRKDPKIAGLPFIFITAKTDRKDFRLGMDLGADDYLTKPFKSYELLNTIQARLKRLSVKARSESLPSKDVERKVSVFTKTEKKIMVYVAQGFSTKNIAGLMSVSEKTIENHRYNMAAKLEIEGKNCLLKFAVEHKLAILKYCI